MKIALDSDAPVNWHAPTGGPSHAPPILSVLYVEPY
jgi:hypothetical protein